MAIAGTYDSTVAIGLLDSEPHPLPKSGWDFVFKNIDAQAGTVTVSAVCANIS